MKGFLFVCAALIAALVLGCGAPKKAKGAECCAPACVQSAPACCSVQPLPRVHAVLQRVHSLLRRAHSALHCPLVAVTCRTEVVVTAPVCPCPGPCPPPRPPRVFQGVEVIPPGIKLDKPRPAPLPPACGPAACAPATCEAPAVCDCRLSHVKAIVRRILRRC